MFDLKVLLRIVVKEYYNGLDDVVSFLLINLICLFFNTRKI